MTGIKENETVIKKQRHVIDKITFLPLYLLPSLITLSCPHPLSVLNTLRDERSPTDLSSNLCYRWTSTRGRRCMVGGTEIWMPVQTALRVESLVSTHG